MLYHHSNQDYQVAASAAAASARDIMERKLEGGKASAVALLEHVHSSVPTDTVIRGRAIKFTSDDGVTAFLEGATDQRQLGLHKHALGQIAQKSGVPFAYLQDLVTSDQKWKQDLGANILNQHFSQDEVAGSRHLVRAVGPQVRAVLSDRYRRLDSRPLLDQFAASCQEMGAIPVNGTVTDTRVALKAFLPMVFEPVPNEVMCLGVEWSNSDFGAGKHAVRAFIWRLWCTNFATMEDCLGQVHIGGRLAENVEFSERTYALDTQATASALKDIIKGALGPKSVSATLETIKQANEKELDWKSVSARLSKKLLKEEYKAVKDAFESDDTFNLPAGKSLWRVSNAISWIAGKTEDSDKKLALQRFAGEVINGKVDAVQAEAA